MATQLANLALYDTENKELSNQIYVPWFAPIAWAVSPSAVQFLRANLDLYLAGNIPKHQAYANEFVFFSEGTRWVDAPERNRKRPLFSEDVFKNLLSLNG